ncbi:MAG: DUF928 domain-containing protein [Moorea sp. SIO2B7]|nr:DUF928 domain-containing protein [Moorena sp. SIO2B7]
MKKIKQFVNSTYLILVITGIVITSSIYSLQVTGQSIPLRRNYNNEKLNFIPPPTANQNANDNELGRPRNRSSGGGRNPCLEQLIALVPGSGEVEIQEGTCDTALESFLALTLDDRPTFFFYVPQESKSGLDAEFVLLDDNRKFIDKWEISLSGKPGVVSFQIPQPLKETGKEYQWLFSLLIHPRNPADNPTVEGMVKVVELDSDLDSKLSTITEPRERIVFYANHHIWHDALTSLANLNCKNNGDSTLVTDGHNDWYNLLNSVGLGAIAQTPLVDYCTTDE